tara:strand:+ start:1144 stop:2427 length:1284 start_codon:yes stop_codon:yes gene_type:complete
MATKNIVPRANLEGGIGTTSKRWGSGSFQYLTNASTIGGSRITGSFTGSFVGDGSNLTGVAAGIFVQTGSHFNTTSDLQITGSVTASGGITASLANIAGNLEVGGQLNASSISDGFAAVVVAEIDNDEIPIAKLAEDAVTITAGDGLKTGGSVTLGGSVTVDVDVSDFAGTGLKDEGSENLGIDFSDSTFGTNISGSFTAPSASISTRLTTEESNVDTLQARNLTAGDGLSGGGTLASDRTFAVEAAQTTITSVKHNSLVIGGNSQNNTIDFGTDDVILFDTDNTERMRVDAGGVDVTGALTVSTNLTIDGNLVVNGDTTTLSTTNLAVGDQFIFTATGSASTNVDSGLIIQSGSSVDSGSAIYHDKNDQRWSVAKGISSITTAVTPLEHVVTVKSLGDDDIPVEGDKEYGVGEIAINSDGTIWIYS